MRLRRACKGPYRGGRRAHRGSRWLRRNGRKSWREGRWPRRAFKSPCRDGRRSCLGCARGCPGRRRVGLRGIPTGRPSILGLGGTTRPGPRSSRRSGKGVGLGRFGRLFPVTGLLPSPLPLDATLDAGRGVLIVVADGREVERVDDALARELGDGRHVALTAELGPAERYRRWLAVSRGRVRVVVGTRAAIFAPVHDLGLVVLWDDGDDVHSEPHAPYPHAREVLALRAHRAGAGALIGGYTRTTDGTQLVDTGWAHPLVPAGTVFGRRCPTSGPPGTTRTWRGMRPLVRRGFLTWRSVRPGRGLSMGLCSSRCPGEGTSPRSPVRVAGGRRGVRSVKGRWRSLRARGAVLPVVRADRR